MKRRVEPKINQPTSYDTGTTLMDTIILAANLGKLLADFYPTDLKSTLLDYKTRAKKKWHHSRSNSILKSSASHPKTQYLGYRNHREQK